MHYKRCRYFLINGVTRSNDGIYEFSTGQKEHSEEKALGRMQKMEN